MFGGSSSSGLAFCEALWGKAMLNPPPSLARFWDSPLLLYNSLGPGILFSTIFNDSASTCTTIVLLRQRYDTRWMVAGVSWTGFGLQSAATEAKSRRLFLVMERRLQVAPKLSAGVTSAKSCFKLRERCPRRMTRRMFRVSALRRYIRPGACSAVCIMVFEIYRIAV